MIDSMLDDDSPVSCDPAHSRDVYQVAIDELTNGGQTGSFNRDDIAAAARAVSGSQAAPAAARRLSWHSLPTRQPITPTTLPRATRTLLPIIRTLMKPLPRTRRPLPPAVPPRARFGALLLSSRRLRLRRTTQTSPACLSSPVPRTSILTTSMNLQPSPHRLMPKIASTPATFRTPRSRSMSPWPITRATRTCGPPPPRFWMRLTSPLLLQSPLPVAAPQPAAPAYVGRHSAVFPEDTARISRESIERAEAIAAGIMENRRHERVNQILEEGDRAPAVLYRQAYGPCLSERYRGRYRQLRAAPRGGITSAWLR